jgi:hypothetical protein
MNWLHNLLSKITGLFVSDKAKAAGHAIESLLPYAIEIVKDINLLAPNNTLAELNAVATKYVLPTIAAIHDGQTAGNIALNLGTQILQKNHAPDAAVSILNTAIQLAVVGLK